MNNFSLTKYLNLLIKDYLIFTVIFFVLSFIGILHHEIWLDEAHHWLLARDSSNLKELIYNTRYEGHPLLWNIILFIISRFTYDVFWMQFFHIIISTLTVFVFFKKAPFNVIFKILFVFGYFMLFEYTLLSRNYMLGVLLVFLAMSYYQERNKKFIIFSLFLALASNIHLIFFGVAFSILLTSAFEQFKTGNLLKKDYLLGYLLFLSGFILLIIQIIPPDDSVFFNDINNLPFFKRVLKGFISLWNGLICVPDFRSIHFWNTNIFINISKEITAVFGILIYLIPFLLFYRNKKVLLYIIISLICMQIFFFVTQRGNARSEGVIFIIFIIGLWMEKFTKPDPIKGIKKINNIEKFKKITVYLILCIHFFSGIVAYAIDYKYPFTPSKDIVDYLHKNNYSDRIIITDFCDGPISSYKESVIYSLCVENYRSYCHWNVTCKTDILHSNKKRYEALNTFLEGKTTSCIFITLNPLITIENIKKGHKIKLLKTFENSIIPNRDYTIYEIYYSN